MRIAVHAGFHKTGTTTFQNLILANREKAPAGLHFEVPGLAWTNALRFALQDYHVTPSADRLQMVRDLISQMIGDCVAAGTNTLFISLESICGRVFGPWERGLYPTARPVLETICEVSSGHELIFLFSTREPVSWIRSLHAHKTRRNGLRMPLSKFSNIRSFENIDWDELFKSLTDGLDADVRSTSLQTTQRLRLGPLSDLLEPFVDQSLLSRWEPVPASNKSLPPKAISLIQAWPVRIMPDSLRGMIVRKMIANSKRS